MDTKHEYEHEHEHEHKQRNRRVSFLDFFHFGHGGGSGSDGGAGSNNNIQSRFTNLFKFTSLQKFPATTNTTNTCHFSIPSIRINSGEGPLSDDDDDDDEDKDEQEEEKEEEEEDEKNIDSGGCEDHHDHHHDHESAGASEHNVNVVVSIVEDLKQEQQQQHGEESCHSIGGSDFIEIGSCPTVSSSSPQLLLRLPNKKNIRRKSTTDLYDDSSSNVVVASNVRQEENINWNSYGNINNNISSSNESTTTTTIIENNHHHHQHPVQLTLEDKRLLRAVASNDIGITIGTTGTSIMKSRVSRPRLFSHPNVVTSSGYLLPEIQTAPILNFNHHQLQLGLGPMKFFLPYFRRASHTFISSSSQGLTRSESMVSLQNKALLSFIAEENIVGVQHVLETKRVIIDDRDESGGTVLMIAAQRGNPRIVRSLIEHGADVNAEDADNWTPLLFASKEGHDEVVSHLLDNGAVVDHRDMGGWTSLMWACYKGRTKAARLLMEKNADVNAYGNYNVTCLGWAAGRGYREIVRDLIQHGAKVNTGDKYGTTPLIWACRKGDIEIVDMLINAEANVDACGMTSWTPILVATGGNHIEVVKLLLEHKPNVNALDKDGCSALTIACKDGFHENAVALINYGAYINISDRGGSSNLVHAAKGGHRSIVEALLKKHADVSSQGKDRKTALYWAVEKSHVGVVKLLLGANPDLEVPTKDGDTSLMKAVRNRNAELVALLIERRAKVNAADKNGDTCLHIAMRARAKQIVELLLRNPVHSQLLYRPNRSGETPYNIDRSSPKPILPQIFGHRGLNTQEDGENLLGYSLYSSALADMLSDPSLNMPITVGLFARWGSGKSFLLSKLREEMKSFARQWINPVFSFSILTFVVTICLASIVGVIGALAVTVTELRWIVGLGFTFGLISIVHAFLFIVWFSSQRAKYEWSWSNRLSRYLAIKMDALRLICQVIFCHPPGSQYSDQIQAQPINFYFTEQTKISSTTGGENSVVQMLGSLYTCLENDYGSMPTRLYRAFRPRPVSSTSDWKWRKLCCIPYCIIFLFCFGCTLLGTVVVVLSHLSDTITKDKFSAIYIQVVMYSCVIFVGLLIVANLYTIGQVMKSIIFSHRRHLQRTVSKLYAVKAEGFLHSLKSEVNLITDMVKCLDAYTGRQSRMVVIVDGLDSGEQEKVLQVLDAVHILFSDAKAPFIILLAIDPHMTAKGIEMNINPVLNESNIGGHDYLRNLVHLPFFLQNAALRKVKQVKMLENSMKKKYNEDDPGPQIILSTRRASVESAFGIAMSLERFEKPSKKTSSKRHASLLKTSDSLASSLASNLNKVTSGPTDLKKMLLGDDYFSDVNPRSMRRLMNIIHITGRLLKAFNIDFNWYHLSTWVNVTEQWPYRLSWMILYCEQFQKDLDDSLSLKTVCERVRPFVPTSKEVDVNVALDRDDKKLDVYLGLHKGSLLVSTMYVFLPFTISLDPQLRKDITELYQPLEQIFKQSPSSYASAMQTPSSPYIQPPFPHNLRFRNTGRGHTMTPQYGNNVQTQIPQIYSGMNQVYHPGLWPFTNPLQQGMLQFQGAFHPPTIGMDPSLMRELKNKKLCTMSIDGVCDLMTSLSGLKGSNIVKYQETIRSNNVCGRVLLYCDLMELKDVLQMNFGDWEMFKNALYALREMDRGDNSTTPTPPGGFTRSDSKANLGDGSVRISITSPERHLEAAGKAMDSSAEVKKQLRPNILQKQVTMEEQMICGALELLNDDARDDARKGEDSPPSTLSPINSEPEPMESSRKNSKSSTGNFIDQNETDVLYVMGTSLNITAELPDSPSVLRKLGDLAGAAPGSDTKFSILNEQVNYPSLPLGIGRNTSIPRTRTESELIPIPERCTNKSQGQRSTSSVSPQSKSLESPGKRFFRSLSKNQMAASSTSTTATTTTGIVSTSYPGPGGGIGMTGFRREGSFKEGSVGRRVVMNPKSPGMGYEGRRNSSRRNSRKDHQHAANVSAPPVGAGIILGDSSTETSSDESQKALIVRTATAALAHVKKVSITKPPSSPKKRITKEDSSMSGRLSKIKSSFFGGQSKDIENPSNVAKYAHRHREDVEFHVGGGRSSSREHRDYHPQTQTQTEESSEPGVYFREPHYQSKASQGGQPWTQYRAPTPLPPFGTEEYYRVIKSSNPSPTTSNESELGSTPEELSSGENLFLPGPPDLPESPYPRRSTTTTNNPPPEQNYLPEFNFTSNLSTTTPSSTSFIPFHNQIPKSSELFPLTNLQQEQNTNSSQIESQQEQFNRISTTRRLHGRMIASSGEDTHHENQQVIFLPHNPNNIELHKPKPGHLIKTSFMKSDPVLSCSTSSSLPGITFTVDKNSTTSGGPTLSQIQSQMNTQLQHEKLNQSRSSSNSGRVVNIIVDDNNKNHNDEDEDENSHPTSPLTRQGALDHETRENTPAKQ